MVFLLNSIYRSAVISQVSALVFPIVQVKTFVPYAYYFKQDCLNPDCFINQNMRAKHSQEQTNPILSNQN